jgi:putative phosphoribosyl transferase
MISREPSPPLFDDRADAGRQLAAVLADRPDVAAGPVVVLGLARGGVPVAAEVARALSAPLGVLVVRKVGHPLQPEFGLGAVTPGGEAYVRESGGLSDEELRRVVERASAQAAAMHERFAGLGPPADPEGAVCVLVDDGLATGATMIAAARWARGRRARVVLAAVPVASTEGVALLAPEVDEVVCPYVTDAFWAVSVWYRTFAQVEDETVAELLREAAARTRTT